MQRLVKIEVKNINIGTGFLISLPDDEERDVILTVCHIFGENKGDFWEMWQIESEDVKILSDYYSTEFEVTDILYKAGDADVNDFALIYIKKFNRLIDEPNLNIPKNDEEFQNYEVIIEGYGRDEDNNSSRVIYGRLYNFVNHEKSMYRVNYIESDRVGDLTTVEVNRGMSGAPVYIHTEKNDCFIGMQKMVCSEKSTDGILGIFTYKYCLEQVNKLYSVSLPLKCEMANLINNDSLFKHIHVMQKNFNIIPTDKKHIGASIEYEDIYELREAFLQELIYTMIDWVYCSEKYETLVHESMSNGKSERAACSEIQNKVYRKFRVCASEEILAQGQIAELLLFHFIQRFLGAVPLLRKEKIQKQYSQYSSCSDVIHYKNQGGKNVIVMGEARSFNNTYGFKEAFAEALDGIITTYKNHRNELELYTHENFLDEEMNKTAESYLNRTMVKPQVNLVNIIMYNEIQKLSITDEEDIRNQIEDIIKERYSEFENDNIDIQNNPILEKITYVIFPIWEIEDLAKKFQELL